MSNDFIDPICNTGNGLNPSLFPVGTAQHLDINYNILPFLCDLLKATTDGNVSPLLTDPPTPFDLSPYTDFTELYQIGDPRVSLGEVMTQTYIYFLPRVIAQTETRQSGGSRVVDGYICTSDGVPIKKSETIPAILSLDLTGESSYKYGSITIPPLSSTYEELMKPFDSQEVKMFVNGYINSAKNTHSEYFVNYIRKYFKGWTPIVNVYDTNKTLIVELTLTDEITKATQTVYLRYYFDVANKVSCLLGLGKMNYYFGPLTPSSVALAMASSAIIPNYLDLMNDSDKGLQYYNQIMGIYHSTPDKQYTTLLSNSAIAVAFFNDLATKVSTSSMSSVNVTPCF